MREFTDPWVLVGREALRADSALNLNRDESRHVARVLRRRPGDGVVLADGCGTVAQAVISECSRSAVSVKIGSLTKIPEPTGGVFLVLAVLHTKAMDWAVQKAVELGARAVQPVVCARSQGDLKGALRRLGHWRSNAEQALKQCRRPWAMPVKEPLTLGGWLGTSPEPGLVGDADGEGAGVASQQESTNLLIGPEGGLTGDELAVLEAAGWARFRLGPHILRSETAAVAGLAVLSVARLGYTPAP